MNLILRIISGDSPDEHLLEYKVDLDGTPAVIAATIRAVADALNPPPSSPRPIRT